MCAVARKRWESYVNHHFDGKIGIWTFIFKEPAKISSKIVQLTNRAFNMFLRDKNYIFAAEKGI